jgi:hemoglobin
MHRAAARVLASLLLLPVLALAACCCPSPCADPCRLCCPQPCCPRVDWAKVKPAQPAKATLYERLGGLDVITAAVDDFLPRLTGDAVVMGNAAVKERLAKADAKALRQHLIDQICCAAGGPCTYKGRGMRESHAGLNITEAEWAAGAAHFAATLDKFAVPAAERAELLEIVGATKGEIVGH